MPIVEWSANYELGIEQFDDHHKHLVELINLAFESFTGEASRDELGALFDELLDYVTYHFTAEESWMQEHNYPEFQKHRDEHDHFCRRVIEIQKDFRKGMANITLEILQFLMNWLTDHILGSDADYARFSKGKPSCQ